MSQRAFEDFVRTSLAGAADAAPPAPPLPRRRVTARQVALMGAAGVLALAGTFGAVRVGSDVFAGPEMVPVAPGERMLDARGAGGEYPCELGSGPQDEASACIATGERDGVTWTLGVSVERNGDLCMVLETVGGPGAAGAGSSCGEYEPGAIGLDQTGIGDLPLLAYGHVPATAESLYLEQSGGDSFELEIYPAPEGSPVHAGFYLVWLPEDAARLVAYGSDGEVVADRDLDSSRPDAPPAGEFSYVTVAEGTHEGVPWVLEVYGVNDDGREVTCTRVLVGPHLTRPYGPCDASFGDGSAIGVSASSAPELPGWIALGGVTDPATGSVMFSLPGREIEAQMFDSPPGPDPDLRFFVAFLPDEKGEPLRTTATVRDRSGEVVERRDLCVPGGDGFSC
ncbi:MAG TPA: hypothetical protein VG318_11465 [Actinomycetota bacterium]|nr:hypothetical protein [Actinomycetota bacterium]